MNNIMSTLPNLIALLFLFLTTASLLVIRYRGTRGHGAAILTKLAAPLRTTLAWQRRAAGGQGTRRGLSIQVRDRAVAHRALVQQSAAFLDRPTPVVPSSILSQNRHFNILAARYGPYWRAVRRNLVAGVLSPSARGHGRIGGVHARALRDLVRALRSGAPMCFGRDVVSGIGEARLRAMEKFQWDLLMELPSFVVFATHPRIVRFLYPSRWRRLLAYRRFQEETYLPLVGEVKKRKAAGGGSTATTTITYVESLLDVRLREDGDRALTDGEIVSLMSEFLGVATETTASSLQWTMANLVKHPELQEKLRLEVDAIAGGGEGAVGEDELSRMPYLRAVVLESLRRHPPIPFAWSEPMAFVPERFMPGGEGHGVDLACSKEFKMMPFGAGKRVCPGLAQAMLHLEYFVANLVREFEWREVEGDEVDLTDLHAVILTVMKRPLRARLVPRRTAPAVAVA
ncbi:hypothetical protein ACP70R_002674 [Stipagrostis hirtigluma subsp. patula]